MDVDVDVDVDLDVGVGVRVGVTVTSEAWDCEPAEALAKAGHAAWRAGLAAGTPVYRGRSRKLPDKARQHRGHATRKLQFRGVVLPRDQHQTRYDHAHGPRSRFTATTTLTSTSTLCGFLTDRDLREKKVTPIAICDARAVAFHHPGRGGRMHGGESPMVWPGGVARRCGWKRDFPSRLSAARREVGRRG